jgi:hypothetical protein
MHGLRRLQADGRKLAQIRYRLDRMPCTGVTEMAHRALWAPIRRPQGNEETIPLVQAGSRGFGTPSHERLGGQADEGLGGFAVEGSAHASGASKNRGCAIGSLGRTVQDLDDPEAKHLIGDPQAV